MSLRHGRRKARGRKEVCLIRKGRGREREREMERETNKNIA